MRRWIPAGLGLAGVIAAAAIVGAALGISGTPAPTDGIHGAAPLPQHIHLCNRFWQRDALDRRFTAAEAGGAFSEGFVVVNPDAPGSCPPGPCTDVATPGACEVVVWVRGGDDAYVDYALSGGP